MVREFLGTQALMHRSLFELNSATPLSEAGYTTVVSCQFNVDAALESLLFGGRCGHVGPVLWGPSRFESSSV